MFRSSIALVPSNTSSTRRAPTKTLAKFEFASKANADESESQAPAHATVTFPGRRASGVLHAPRTNGRFASHAAPRDASTPAKGPVGG